MTVSEMSDASAEMDRITARRAYAIDTSVSGMSSLTQVSFEAKAAAMVTRLQAWSRKVLSPIYNDILTGAATVQIQGASIDSLLNSASANLVTTGGSSKFATLGAVLPNMGEGQMLTDHQASQRKVVMLEKDLYAFSRDFDPDRRLISPDMPDSSHPPQRS